MAFLCGTQTVSLEMQADLGAVVDLLDQKKLVEIHTYSQRFTNNPNEKFLLMILGSQAKLENDNKSNQCEAWSKD